MRSRLKQIIKKISKKLPVLDHIILFYRKHRKNVSQDKSLSKESRLKVFSTIYSNKVWGGNADTDFYSGGGSYYDELIVPYCKEIRKFIDEKNIRTVIDFGCGDFNVAAGFVSDKIDYIGVDIVPELIRRNTEKYATKHVSFLHMDIVEDEAPDADLCLVREVFQHLSNEEIQQALKHMMKYHYIIVTESVVKKELLGGNYNLNKAHGNSFGVYLEEAPFYKKTQKLLQIPYPGIADQEMITSLIINDE